MVREAPKEELIQAYRKLTRLHDGIRYEVSMAAFSDALTEIEDLLLQAYGLLQQTFGASAPRPQRPLKGDYYNENRI